MQSSSHQKARSTLPSGSTTMFGKPNLSAISSVPVSAVPVIPDSAPCQSGAVSRLTRRSPSSRETVPQSPGASCRRYAEKILPSGSRTSLLVWPRHPARPWTVNALPSGARAYGVGSTTPVFQSRLHATARSRRSGSSISDCSQWMTSSSQRSNSRMYSGQVRPSSCETKASPNMPFGASPFQPIQVDSGRSQRPSRSSTIE